MGNGQKYQIDTDENRAFLKEVGEGILRFGKRFPSPGGSSYYLGDDGTPWTDRPRETWITSRMVHVYSIGHMMGYEGCGQLADQGLKGLMGELHDDAEASGGRLQVVRREILERGRGIVLRYLEHGIYGA